MAERLPSVSVVVACHNYGHFLKQCAESVLSQQGVDVDLLIIDDCSTDDSFDVAQQLADADPRVRIRRHEVNAGYIATFNEGLSEAAADYTVKLDADDLLLPGALQRATTVLDLHPSVGFVYGRPLRFDGSLPPARQGDWSHQIWEGAAWLGERCRKTTNCICNPEVVMRTSVLHAAGMFKSHLKHTCDLELWLEMSALCDVAYITGVDQAAYREHPTSMQRTVNSGPVIDFYGRRDAFSTAFEGAAGKLERAVELRSIASRALALKALDAACHLVDRGRSTPQLLEELTEFAEETWPGVTGSRRWRQLERRRRMGTAKARLFPPFITHALFRRVRYEYNAYRWRRRGV